MTFYVGQKVVCVDDKPRYYPTVRLVEGEIYTFAGYGPLNSDNECGVFVFEVDSQNQLGFYADRFRPVVEKKTDISIFEAMLNVQPSKLDEQV